MRVDEIRILIDQSRLALGQGRFQEALELADRVLEENDGHEQALNLKGMILFKQERFGDAVDLFHRLVDKYPTDATLLMNLGLAYLKSEQHEAAIPEFKKALEHKGDGPKIHNYLGLAYSGIGKFREAQEHFQAGGSKKMADQMLSMLRSFAGEPEPEAPAAPATPGDDTLDRSFGATFGGGASAAPAVAEVEVEVEPEIEAEIEVEPVEVDAEESAPAAAEVAAPPAVGSKKKAAPAAPPAESPAPVAAAAPTDLLGNALSLLQRRYEGVIETLEPGAGLTELGEHLELRPEDGRPISQMRPNVLRLQVAPGEVALSRVGHVLGVEGGVKIEPRKRRYKGKDTRTTFGGDDDTVCELIGQGAVWLGLDDGDVFQTIRMDGELAYVSETLFHALAGEWRWENGQLPGAKTSEVHVVQLRGRGMLALRVPKGQRLASIRLTKQKLALPVRILAGWYGNIVPVLGDLGLTAGGHQGEPSVQFQGDGTVLLLTPTP